MYHLTYKIETKTTITVTAVKQSTKFRVCTFDNKDGS